MAQRVGDRLADLTKQAEANHARIQAAQAKERELQAKGDTAGFQRQSQETVRLIQEQNRLNEQRNRLGKTADIERDIASGVELGKELIADKSLGRIDTGLGRVDAELGRVKEGQFKAERSEDIEDVIKRRREALSGLSGTEQQTRRDIALGEIGRSEQLQQRQLQAIQSQTGVRGGTAAAQQIDLLRQSNIARANFERDLFLQNEQIKRQALTDFERSVTAAEATEAERTAANVQLTQFNLAQQLRERELSQFNLEQQRAERELEKFNLQQTARERFGQLSVGLGVASLVQGDVASQRAVEAQKAAAAAAGSGGK